MCAWPCFFYSKCEHCYWRQNCLEQPTGYPLWSWQISFAKNHFHLRCSTAFICILSVYLIETFTFRMFLAHNDNNGKQSKKSNRNMLFCVDILRCFVEKRNHFQSRVDILSFSTIIFRNISQFSLKIVALQQLHWIFVFSKSVEKWENNFETLSSTFIEHEPEIWTKH